MNTQKYKIYKKRQKYCIVSLLFILCIHTPSIAYSKSEQTEKRLHVQNPAYAKWGKFAMNATKQKYPSALIVDYKYIGQKELAANQAVDTFKFWLQQDKREWGVYVQVIHRTTSDQILAVKFKESSR